METRNGNVGRISRRRNPPFYGECGGLRFANPPYALAKIKRFQLVATDYSENEFVKEISMQKDWIDMAKTGVIENRMFINRDMKTEYLD